MKGTTYQRNGVRSTEAARLRGIDFIRRINASADQPLSNFLQQGLEYGFPARTWRQIAELRLHEFESSALSLPSPMPRHKGVVQRPVIIPNAWASVDSKENIAAFLEARAAGSLMQKLSDEWGGFDLLVEASARLDSEKSAEASFEWFFLALEATLPGRVPQIHLAYLNLRSDFPLPESIDLIGHKYTAKGSRYPDETIPTDVGDIVEELKNARKRKRPYRIAVGIIAEHLHSASGRRLAILKCVVLVLHRGKKMVEESENGNVIVKTPAEYKGNAKLFSKHRTALVSVERYLRAFRKAYDILRPNKEVSEDSSMGRPERRALEIMAQVLSSPRGEIKCAGQRGKKVEPLRPIVLMRPDVIRGYYNLDGTPDLSISDVPLSARRIVSSILHYSGRRGVCLALVELGDFTIERHPISNLLLASLTIRWTKGGRARNARITISSQWPAQELYHLEAFLRATAHLPRTVQLLAVANLGPNRAGLRRKRYDRETLDLAQYAISSGLTEQVVNTHLGRYFYASYFFLRVYCVRYPWVGEHPDIQKLTGHHWFSPEGLAQLEAVLAEGPASAMEILRRHLGLTTSRQIYERYARAWLLEMKVWRDVIAQIDCFLRGMPSKVDAFWEQVTQ